MKFSNNHELLLIVSYIPPNSPIEIYETHLKNCNYYIDNLKSHQNVLYAGDFNLGSLKWNPFPAYVPFEVITSTDSVIFDFVCLHNLTQINKFNNENNRILDLIFVNETLVTNCMEPPVPIFNSTFHHSPILIEFFVQDFQPYAVDTKYIYDFNNANFLELNTFISSFNWESTFLHLDLLTMYSTFLEILHEGICNNIPKKKNSSFS